MNDNLVLPVIIEDDAFLAPSMVVPIFLNDKQNIMAAENAANNNNIVLVVCSKNMDDIGEYGFYDVGVIGQIMRQVKLPDGRLKLLFKGESRGRIENITNKDPLIAQVSKITYKDFNNNRVQALLSIFLEKVRAFAHISQSMSPEVLRNIEVSQDPNKIIDLAISTINLKKDQNYILISNDDIEQRIIYATQLISEEIEAKQLQRDIKSKVHNKMEKVNRDFFLKEQLKQIQKELGLDRQKEEEIEQYVKKLESLKPGMNDGAYKEIKKQIDRLSRSHPDSSDSNTLQNYVEWMLEIPFTDFSSKKLSIRNVEKQLNSDHYSLEEPKQRIVEYFAVRQLLEQRNQKDSKNKGTIICFYGPPGVGKTSLANSIALAINRPLVRIALGGLEDVNELRGHRRTYVGSMPGRILQGLIDSKKMNPVMVLDEIDKVVKGVRGDPTSVLLEILDPEQNVSFRDYYANFNIDLSQVIFIATANDIGNIPPPLRDRMEFIAISSYTPQEKFEIAKKYLIPQEIKNHGLTSNELRFSKEAIEVIIHNYTREAGVRNLRRRIAQILRKVAIRVLDGERDAISIKAKDLESYLKKSIFEIDKSNLKPKKGVVNGLAWTSVGGDVLKIEAITLTGKGLLKLTGQLGEVMRESAQIAYSVVKDRLDKEKIKGLKQEELESYKSPTSKIDIHLHVPEGATPKDGPSAGIAMACTIASVLFDSLVRQDIAMTGELNLSGDVLPIGGLREKLIAAYKAECKKALIPIKNKRDLDDIPEIIKEKMEIIPVATIDEVFKEVLISN